MRLYDRLRGTRSVPAVSTIDDLARVLGSFSYNGVEFSHGVGTTMPDQPSEKIVTSFDGYASSLFKAHPIIFAAANLRQQVFSEARFAYRRYRNGIAQEPFTDSSLSVLERPWPGGTTGDLLARMDQDVVLAGNFYATVSRGRVRRLRPDWVDVLIGSDTERDDPTFGIDSHVVGYAYWPGGRGIAKRPVLLPASDVAHYAPIPDPQRSWIGMSPLQPVVLEAMGHKAAATHKVRFFDNAATPNLVFTLDANVTREQLETFAQMVDEGHTGAANAYKNLFLGGGADVTVVGADFKQLDFKVVQGHAETIIDAALGVHPVLVGHSEGMQGSALNAGNYGQARRRFADGTMRPLWRNAAASLENLVNVPAGAELTYDVRGVSFLQEDERDAAEIFASKASAARTLTDGGFDPVSVIAAVNDLDVTKLQHTGLLSVQMQPPGETAGPAASDAPDPQASRLEEMAAALAEVRHRLELNQATADIEVVRDEQTGQIVKVRRAG